MCIHIRAVKENIYVIEYEKTKQLQYCIFVVLIWAKISMFDWTYAYLYTSMKSVISVQEVERQKTRKSVSEAPVFQCIQSLFFCFQGIMLVRTKA